MQFEVTTPASIRFGGGSARQLGKIAASMGKRTLFATNLPETYIASVLHKLNQQDLFIALFTIDKEPTDALITEGINLARENQCDLVIGFGGGSAIDTGKAIAALITNPGEIYDYLEVIGCGKAISNPPVPMIAVPTTAGTGSEVTRNAVISALEFRVKVSLRSRLLLPKLALVDPELTHGLPAEITASTGLDALTQLIEPFVSVRANPFTDGICCEGMDRVARSLLRAYEKDDPLAREDMSLASLFGGLALANSGLGVVHGFAGVLGGMYSAPHGVICARLLPAVMEVNIQALQRRMPESSTLARYTEVARILTGKQQAEAAEGIAWVKTLSTQMGISPLSVYGITSKDYTQIVEKTIRASSTKANPIQLTPDEFFEILEKTP
jgi:alcohol dehydrogenase class IV